MNGLESADPERDGPGAARPKPAGAWAGYLIFGLCLLVLIVFDIQTATAHEWRQLAGWIAVTVGLILIPTGAATWLRRRFRRHRT